MSAAFQVGDRVQVVPGCHREGEHGTVVRPELVPIDLPAECVVPVAFSSVSGGPLWYAPDELVAVDQ